MFCYNLPHSTAFPYPINFAMLCFHFHLSQGTFWFSLWTLWSTGFLRVLFNFHLFEFSDFPSVIVLFHHSKKKDTWYSFSLLKFVKICFAAYPVIYPEDMFHVSLRWMCILLMLGGMFCIYLLGPSTLLCCSGSLFPYWSVWFFYPLLKGGCWNILFLCYHIFFLFSSDNASCIWVL